MREKTYRRLEGLSRIRGGYLSTKELLTAGLTNRQIAALTRENRLQKISHGVYYLEEEGMDKPSDHKALEMAMVNERAVVCAQSACWLHGLFRDEPERFTMATRRDDRHKMSLPFSTTRHYFAVDSFELGVKTVDTPCGTYQIYDMERSLCDCIRFRRELTDARCEEIIENYKKSPKKDLDRLRTYAAALRVSRQVDRMVFGKRS